MNTNHDCCDMYNGLKNRLNLKHESKEFTKTLILHSIIV